MLAPEPGISAGGMRPETALPRGSQDRASPAIRQALGSTSVSSCQMLCGADGPPSLISPTALPSPSPPSPVLRTLEDVTSGKCQVVSERDGALMEH